MYIELGLGLRSYCPNLYTVLKGHMRSAHANEEDLKICHICFYKTSSNQNLKTHIEAKHEKVRNFECPQCDLKFYAKATMVHHIKGKYLTNSSDDFTNLLPRIFLSLSC